MPGVITVPDFIRETREDYTSPTTSTFVNRIPQCRETVNRIDEVRICKRVNLLHQRGDHPIPVSRSEWVSETHKLYNIWACPTACLCLSARQQHSSQAATAHTQVRFLFITQKTCNYNVYIRYPLSTPNTHSMLTLGWKW